MPFRGSLIYSQLICSNAPFHLSLPSSHSARRPTQATAVQGLEQESGFLNASSSVRLFHPKLADAVPPPLLWCFMVTMCEMVTTEVSAETEDRDDAVLVAAAAAPASKTGATECGKSGTCVSISSSTSDSSNESRLGHSVSTDSFLKHNEANVPSLLHRGSAGCASSFSSNTSEQVTETKPFPTTHHLTAPFTGVAAVAPFVAIGDNQGPVQHMIDWERSSKQITTWGTNPVLQQYQQHSLSGSNGSGHAGVAAIACSPAPSAHFKRPRPTTTKSTTTTSSSNHTGRAQTPSNHDISPQEFLWGILQERGYETSPLFSKTQAFFRPPTPKQVEDYDIALLNAVKTGDLAQLQDMAQQGRQMDACNKYGESIVHISCRRGQAETLRFLLAHGGKVHMCDDLGRTPLHDACWAKEPVFDCISTILDADPELIRMVDCRGASPLAYIRRAHWREWKEFFDSKKEKYWAPLPGSSCETELIVRGAPKIEDGEEETGHGVRPTSANGGRGDSPTALHSASAAKPVTASMAGSSSEEEGEEGGEEEGEEQQQPKRVSARQLQRKRSRSLEKSQVDAGVSVTSF